MTTRKRRWSAAVLALTLAVSLLPMPAALAEDPLPASFDLRSCDLDGDGVKENYVTPVKFQNPFGTCWAFGGIAAAEISILSELHQSYQDNPLDLSEKHLVWFATHPVTEAEAGNQAGEGLRFMEEEKKPLGVYNDGGYSIYISTLFSSGVGPVLESEFPYRGANEWTDYSYLLTDKGAEEFKDEYWSSLLDELDYEEGANPSFEEVISKMDSSWSVFQSKEALLETVYQYALTTAKNHNEFSDKDDWSIPLTADDEHKTPNRNLYNGFTLRDGNILPVLHDRSMPDGVDWEGVRAVKKELMAGRGVTLSFRADQSRPNESNIAQYMNPNEWAHYTYEEQVSSHMVCIVGWDDNYPKENFAHSVKNSDTGEISDAPLPAGNGAWIAKNSWGSEVDWLDWKVTNGENVVDTLIGKESWGVTDAEGKHTGYFYLSYYDKSLTKPPETFRFSDDLSGYSFLTSQYDYMPAYSGFCAGESEDLILTANVFTAEVDQLLTSVSTRTVQPDSHVTFNVYLLDDTEGPTSEYEVAALDADMTWAGYHRVNLEKPVPIRAGQRFSVVSSVSYKDENDKTLYQFAASRGPDETLSLGLYDKDFDDTICCTSVVNPGESWLFADGQWTDWCTCKIRTDSLAVHFQVDNFSIKAFAKPWEGPDIESVDLNGDMLEIIATSGDDNATAVCAAYGENGQLLETQAYTFLGPQRLTFQFEAKKIDHVKVFLLDDDSRPLCPCKEAVPESTGQ